MANKKEYWFKRRRYGYGWIPVTRAGIVSVIIYLLIIVIGALSLNLVPEQNIITVMALYLIGLVILTNLFIHFIRAHGPKPKWRWGKSSKDDPRKDF